MATIIAPLHRLVGPSLSTFPSHSAQVAFARRDLPLGKKLVVLNVMWHHLEQRSFPMSEAEYDEKLDMVALYIRWVRACVPVCLCG